MRRFTRLTAPQSRHYWRWIAVIPIVVATAIASLETGPGPHLFLDNHLIEHMQGLRREVLPPERLPNPVLDQATFGTTQNHLTVLPDPEGQRIRAWYNRGDAVWHAESRDGIEWINPRPVLEPPYAFGASVIDEGPGASDPSRRFKLAQWRQNERGQPGPDSGMWVAFSPDGLQWTLHEGNPVLLTWPEGIGVRVPHRTSDIIDVFHDRKLHRYLAFVKLPAVAADGFEPGPRAGALFRRLVGLSTSPDFVNWTRPVRIFEPDSKDEGLLEFYGMAGVHRRGSLYIGFVRILHDEIAAEPGGPVNGVGYTVLATSRDGLNWTRQREPFLQRNIQPGTWDRAVAWGCAVLQMEDETFIYYNGRALGHKVSPSDRQFGLARMKRDRYMALMPADRFGTLRTHAMTVPKGADRMTINANASLGSVKVRVLDEQGRSSVLNGSSNEATIQGDVIAAEVDWCRLIGELQGRSVKLEFEVRDAALFGFEFHSSSSN